MGRSPEISHRLSGPAIELNKDTMEKFAPELKKYYYNPTTYKTYLEQLGVRYPTVR